MNNLRVFLALIAAIFMSNLSSAQQFHFGASAAGLTSQIDGDHLSGFHYFGYSVGVLGGYSINEDNWLQVDLQYSHIGSSQKDETSEMRLPINLEVIGVMMGFSMKIGDSWDGVRRFRILLGPQFNTIIKASASSLSKDDLRNYIAGRLTISHFVSENVLLDLSYTQSLQNILKEPRSGIRKLNPYYISFGASYYLYR